ncbi:OLC1v1022809C1 [Oldenlandia corymbosa var. corymbosa]|uniref:OLC1v1022809C1 n=1 Tax=Oldenlandia corymbosa var. corymbosa TaxID=529605 RepID=A0AAV1BYM4_OLDCO|nr:OLC1v1022809C1 [Oldenlandia corymbosa var. corymbosa]
MDLDPPFSSSGVSHEHIKDPPFIGKDNNNFKSATDLLLSFSLLAEENKAKIQHLVVAASEELKQLVLEKEPFWMIDKHSEMEVLNNTEYNRRFSCLDATLEEVIRVITTGGPVELPEFNKNSETLNVDKSFPKLSAENDFSSMEIEASRAVGFVSADPLSLAKMVIDVEQWSSAFSNIVTRASNLGILSTGELGTPNGNLQVVTAELHFPSPLVRTREICFARYCKQLGTDTWLVVDVSLESIFPNLALRCRRRPSGCLIEALNKGSSKVTWVENNAISDGSLGGMFGRASALAFGAKRWIATLERKFDWKYTLEQFDHTTSPTKKKKKKNAGRKSLLTLADRMVRKFDANVTSCSANQWRSLPITGAENILIKTGINHGQSVSPPVVTVTIATSVRLQKSQKDVFKVLCSVNERDKWDILSHDRVAQEIEQISFGPDPANTVSLLLSMPRSVIEAEDKAKAKKKKEIMYVQETISDSVGLYVIYSPINKAAMHHIMDGKDPDIVSILPSGFVVFPDPDSGGSILTIAFEILDGNLCNPEQQLPPQSVATAYSIIKITLDLIKAAIQQSDDQK